MSDVEYYVPLLANRFVTRERQNAYGTATTLAFTQKSDAQAKVAALEAANPGMKFRPVNLSDRAGRPSWGIYRDK